MKTEVVSRHVFRRTARKQERKLDRANPEQGVYYRTARRRGGMRWVVERVQRATRPGA